MDKDQYLRGPGETVPEHNGDSLVAGTVAPPIEVAATPEPELESSPEPVKDEATTADDSASNNEGDE